MILINCSLSHRSRSLPRPNVNTPSGSVVLFSLRCPLSRTCGAPSRSTMSLVLVLSTAVRIDPSSIHLQIANTSIFVSSRRVFLNGQARNKEIYGLSCSRNIRNRVMLWPLPSTPPPSSGSSLPYVPFRRRCSAFCLLFLLDLFFQPRNLKFHL